MTGGTRLLYDVWGETVTVAHYLARQAPRDSILVSGQTRMLLPDSFDVTLVSDDDDGGAWTVASASVGGST